MYFIERFKDVLSKIPTLFDKSLSKLNSFGDEMLTGEINPELKDISEYSYS